jgi:hypothetical protein
MARHALAWASVTLAVAALDCGGQQQNLSTQDSGAADAAAGSADALADGTADALADGTADATADAGSFDATFADAGADADGTAIESGAGTTSDATDDGLECPPTSCPISPGTIVVDVTDPAGAAVPYPTFLFVGSVLYGTCVGLVDGGAVAWDFNPTLDEDGTPPYDAGDAASIPQGCASWAVRAADSPFGISDGPHTIGVGAPGYVTSSVSFVVTRSCTGASLCQDPAAAVSITLTPGLPCGNTACADDEVCVVPCCGGAAPPCLGSSPSDGGACPAGSHADGTCTADGTGGCRTEQCTPGAPYCSNDAGVCTTLGVPPMDGFVQCNCQ